MTLSPNLGVDNVTTAGGVRVEPSPAAQADAPPVPPSAAYTFVPAEDVVDDDEDAGAATRATAPASRHATAR